MDYLPIQASAVPCERVFSSSSETSTKKRNRMSPLLMEALQLYKFGLKKERLNFTKGWASSEKDMVYEMGLSDEDSTDLLASINSGADSGGFDPVLKAIAEHECDNIPDDAIIY
jgi:hypothetical protein